MNSVSICVATSYPSINSYLVKSILKWSRPREIILAGSDRDFSEIIDNIKIVAIPATLDNFVVDRFHASGLHIALDHATGDYILFCDYDLIFLSDILSLYSNLIVKYDLLFVGCTHYASGQGYANFPCVINCMARRDLLPGPDFLKGELRSRNFLRYSVGPTEENGGEPCDGKWLIQSPIASYINFYPDPRGWFDVGHNLYLWNYQQKGKWISFGTDDGHSYETSLAYGNLEQLPPEIADLRQPLIWHKTGLAEWDQALIAREIS